MKYNELFTSDKGIFATIFKPNYPVQYGVIFGQTIPQTYDVLASFKCGDKTLVDAVTIDDVQEHDEPTAPIDDVQEHDEPIETLEPTETDKTPETL